MGRGEAGLDLAELDAEISRVVFGKPAEPHAGQWLLINDVGVVPPYSRSIELAWLVVERLSCRWMGPSPFFGFGFRLEDDVCAEGPSRTWRATFTISDDAGETEEFAHGATPAEAICKAALAALAEWAMMVGNEASR